MNKQQLAYLLQKGRKVSEKLTSYNSIIKLGNWVNG